MAIDANVAYVELKEDGSGVLHLCDRVPEGSRGQSRLHFKTAPYEVTALNGLAVWGGASELMLGDDKIATREGYTRISFIEREPFLRAVADYHARQREANRTDSGWVERNCRFNCDAASACTCWAHERYRRAQERSDG